MRWLTIPLLLTLSCGGGGGPRTPTDYDAKRGDAKALALSTPAEDRCDPGRGDAVDWHRVELTEASRVNVELRFAEATITANADLRDARGDTLESTTSAAPETRFEGVEVEPGALFVRVACPSQASDYTLTVRAEPLAPPEPEPSEEATPDEGDAESEAVEAEGEAVEAEPAAEEQP